MDDLKSALAHTQQAMEKALEHTQVALKKIRAGRAMPDMLDGILVEYYGNLVPIHQTASISTPDARTIAIKPWEKSLIATIESAISHSKLGLPAQSDGEVIRIVIPPLTEERRKALVKQVKGEAEKGKVAVRNARKEGKEALKVLQKAGTAEDSVKRTEDELQRLTDQYIGKVDTLLTQKEADIMEV